MALPVYTVVYEIDLCTVVGSKKGEGMDWAVKRKM
jgi:hypothetical protein